MKKILFIIPVISLCLFTDNMLFGQTPLPKITIGVDEFKALFSTAQLNRGWTKPQIEDFLERCK